MSAIISSGTATRAVQQDAASGRGPHTLAIDTDGAVYSWGSDTLGQLGIGRALLTTSPTQVKERRRNAATAYPGRLRNPLKQLAISMSL